MAVGAHPEIDKQALRRQLVLDTSVVGVTRVLAANNTIPANVLKELIHTADAEGHEVHLVAGDLRIRPKDSSL